MDWDKKFKVQYDYARAWLQNNGAFESGWQDLVTALYELMTTTGFDAGRADSLDKLRKKVQQGAAKFIGHHAIPESQGILQAVKAWSDRPNATVLDDASKMRAAALKFLRHVYLVKKSGSQTVWVHSLPREFHDWASHHINQFTTTRDAVERILDTDNEIFSETQKKYLASATQQALAWCHRTAMVLADAGSPDAKRSRLRETARELVKRWFADPGTTDKELDQFIGTLTFGFKAIIACLNKGRFILTDWVSLRGATAPGDVDYRDSEAFTFSGFGEGLDVVYIEQSFFKKDEGGIVHGQKNWTRIIVHELSHLVSATEDVNIGDFRYAHYGIGPHRGFPGSAAIRNADSWAFFAADCAAALTEGERRMALRIR
ncbi:hypothetical protein GCM10011611_36610 [Aliidongia dinghuensis]|uniref:Lysine-specific metallo-endopeptidase domain-containing protein n=1 Tax=Aliidongia dinghuensis TaxID=1867774 RepID=A0A8J3E664_9PROT|nr:M35 family metallo-endopeptidase [Aliidongia dinghuensis]GGF27264.1 hypothetical protein GCM10011611_36610 [Aliidongia dinghuensis]